LQALHCGGIGLEVGFHQINLVLRACFPSISETGGTICPTSRMQRLPDLLPPLDRRDCSQRTAPLFIGG
jgi:hypothetical protein